MRIYEDDRLQSIKLCDGGPCDFDRMDDAGERQVLRSAEV
jgi:hypothetical protein